MNIFELFYKEIIEEALNKKQPNEAILNRLATELFSHTNYCTHTTGYVLTDGICLDFSGGDYNRSLDHREIGQIFTKFPKFTTKYMKNNIGGGSGYMLAFMDIASAVRFGASRDTCFINFIHNPNTIQGRKIATYINYLLKRFGKCDVTVEKFDNNYQILKHKELTEGSFDYFENGLEYDFTNYLKEF